MPPPRRTRTSDSQPATTYCTASRRSRKRVLRLRPMSVSATTPIAPPAATHLIATGWGPRSPLTWADVSPGDVVPDRAFAPRDERLDHDRDDRRGRHGLHGCVADSGSHVSSTGSSRPTPAAIRPRRTSYSVKIDTGEATAPPDDPPTAPGTSVVLDRTEDRPAGKNSIRRAARSAEDSPVTEVDHVESRILIPWRDRFASRVRWRSPRRSFDGASAAPRDQAVSRSTRRTRACSSASTSRRRPRSAPRSEREPSSASPTGSSTGCSR